MFSELYASASIPEFKKVYLQVTKLLFFVVLPVSLLFLGYAGTIMRAIFGTSYWGGGTPLRWLVIGYALDTFIGPVGLMTLAIGKTRHYLIYDIVGFLSVALLSLWLIPAYGVSGAAIATAASAVLWNLTGLGFIYKFLKLQPFGIQHLKFFALSTALFLGIYLFSKTFISGWLNPATTIAIYGAISAYLFKRFMALDEEGRKFVSDLEHKLLRLLNVNTKIEFKK